MTEDNSTITALDEAINFAGGQNKLGALIFTKQQTISWWRNKGKVPADKAIAIERATGVDKARLRPDLFDPQVLNVDSKVSVSVKTSEGVS